MSFGEVIARFGADISGFSHGIASMRSQALSFAGHIGSISSSVGGSFVRMGGSLLGAAKGIGSWLYYVKEGVQITAGLASSFFRSNAAMEQTSIAFKGLLGSGKAASAMLKQLQDFAAKTPFEFPDLAKDSQMLLGMGLAAKQVIPWMTAIGDAAAGVGAGTEGVQSITRALGQMQAKTKVSGEEMMQLTEAGIPAWRILASSMGLTVAQVQDLSQKGELGQDAINKLVAGMEKMYSGQMANQALTFNGLISTLKDNAMMALRAFVGPLFEQAKGGLKSLTDLAGSPKIIQFATALGQGVGSALQQIVAFIGPLVTGFGIFFSQLTSGAPPMNSAAYNLQVIWSILQLLGDRISQVFAPAWGLLVKAFKDIFAPAETARKAVEPFGVTLQHIAGTIANFNIGPIRDFVTMLAGAAIQLAIQYIDNLRKNFDMVVTVVTTSIIPAFQKMWPTFVAVGQALAPLLPVFRSVMQSLQQLAGVLRDAIIVAFQTFLPIVADVVNFLGSALIPIIKMVTPAFQWAATAIKQFVDDLSTRLGPAIKNIGKVIGDFVRDVQTVWKAVWPTLAPILQGVWNVIFGIIKVAWALVSGIIKVGLDILGGNWDQAWTDIKDMFKGVWDGIVTILRGEWQILVGIFNGILSFLANLWNRISGDVSQAWNGMWKTIGDWTGKIWKDMVTWGGNVFTAIMKPFRDFGAGVGSVLRGAINTVITWLNSGIDRLNDFIQFFARGINSVSSALGAGNVIKNERPVGKIGYLASGTDNWRGGVAMVGERGPELAYLPQGSAVLDAQKTRDVMHNGGLSPQRIPGFAAGLGDIWNWVISGVSSLGSNIFKSFGAPPDLPGVFGKMSSGIIAKVTGWIGTWVNKLVTSISPGAPGNLNLPLAQLGEFLLPRGGGFHQMLWYGIHQGMDFQFPQGSPLREVIGGRVSPHTGWYPWGGEVDVQLVNGLLERYEHLSQIFVKAGDIVRRGQLIGLTGGGTPASGLGYWSTGSHLHYQVDTGTYGSGINPLSVWKAFGIFKPFAKGGIINEQVLGVGLSSGQGYSFGENGPETIIPGVGGGSRRVVDLLERIERHLSNPAHVNEYQLTQALMRLLANGVS